MRGAFVGYGRSGKFATMACSPAHRTTRAGGRGGHHLHQVLHAHERDHGPVALPGLPEPLFRPEERVAQLRARLEVGLELAPVVGDGDRRLQLPRHAVQVRPCSATRAAPGGAASAYRGGELRVEARLRQLRPAQDDRAEEAAQPAARRASASAERCRRAERPPTTRTTSSASAGATIAARSRRIISKRASRDGRSAPPRGRSRARPGRSRAAGRRRSRARPARRRPGWRGRGKAAACSSRSRRTRRPPTNHSRKKNAPRPRAEPAPVAEAREEEREARAGTRARRPARSSRRGPGRFAAPGREALEVLVDEEELQEARVAPLDEEEPRRGEQRGRRRRRRSDERDQPAQAAASPAHQSRRIAPGSASATSPFVRKAPAAAAPVAAASPIHGAARLAAPDGRAPGEQRRREEEGEQSVRQVRAGHEEPDRAREQQDAGREALAAPAARGQRRAEASCRAPRVGWEDGPPTASVRRPGRRPRSPSRAGAASRSTAGRSGAARRSRRAASISRGISA